MKISIARIKAAKQPIRGANDGEPLKALAQSMKRLGQIVPIKVCKDGDNYRVVYGHRRLAAARMAGLKELECIVEGVNDLRASQEALAENVIRENMTDFEVAQALLSEKTETGETHEQIGARYGWTDGTVRGYLVLVENPEIRKAVEARPATVGLQHKVKEARAGTKDDKLAAQVLRKAAREDLSRPQVRQVADAVGAARSPEMREHLLKTPFSTLLHDRRAVQARPRVPAAAAIKKDWSTSPAVAAVIDHLRRFTERFDVFRDSADAGKFSPEAARFVAKRMRDAGRELLSLADYIERKSK